MQRQHKCDMRWKLDQELYSFKNLENLGYWGFVNIFGKEKEFVREIEWKV